MEILYLSQADVKAVGITMAEIISRVEEVFVEKGNGRIEMPPKPGIHPQGDAFIHAMPAYVPRMSAAGCKWVSGFPENYKYNLPQISGLLIMNDPQTGLPLTVMDCIWITAMRTGAATAVAAKYLARSDSAVVAIIGCGVQGRTNLEALTIVFPAIEEVRAYDINPKNITRYVKEAELKYERRKPRLKIIPVNSRREAVVEADIIVTASAIQKHPHPVIEASWVKEGAFASPVDFDSYWKPEALQIMDKVCTDDIPQIEYYKTQGYFAHLPLIYADLGEIVTGKKAGRENPSEKTMSMNLGVAIEDMAVGSKIYQLAVEKGIGRKLPL